MGITNAIMVGHLGGAALAAAGIGGAIYFTLCMICQGVLNAVAPLAAHAIGSGSREAAGLIAGAGITMAALLALPVLVLLSLAPLLLHAIGYDPALADSISGYLGAIRWGAPAFLLSAALRAMLSASGRPRVIMVVLLCGIPANAALSWILIFGHLGLPALGIAGSGWSTAAIQWTMMLSLAGYMALAPGHAPVRFGLRVFREFGSILRVGLPIGGLFAMEVGVFNTTGLLMGLFGADALGAHQLAINVASFTFMVPLGIAQAAVVRVALHLGAGEPAAAVRAGRTAVALAALCMLGASALLVASPRTIIGLYLDVADPVNRGVVPIAVSLIMIAALFQVLDGVQVVAVGALRGYRDTAVPMLIAAVGYWVVGFTGGWALAFPLGWGPVGLWCGLALGLAVVACALTLRLELRGRPRLRGAIPSPQPAAL
jgi:MATE family multidrug resistance protein